MPESYKEDGRPAQQWYWDDWFSAFDARLCSLAARGLWIDMLGIMWKAEIRGTLTVNGRQIDGKTLAKIVNAPVLEIRALIKELEINNVFSRLEDGTIICRRVFRESGKKDEISKIRSKVGKEGAEKRWQKIAKMATPSPSSTPTPISSSKKKILFNFAISKWENIEDEDTLGWRDAYPACDVDSELKKMREWLLANPEKKKKNYRRFIVNWLIRTQDKGGTRKEYKTSQVGQSYEKEPSLVPTRTWAEAYKLLDRKKWKSNSDFYDKVKSVYPQIKPQWEQSDKTPETFIRLVEGA